MSKDIIYLLDWIDKKIERYESRGNWLHNYETNLNDLYFLKSRLTDVLTKETVRRQDEIIKKFSEMSKEVEE